MKIPIKCIYPRHEKNCILMVHMAIKFLFINQELYDKEKFISHVLVHCGEHIFSALCLQSLQYANISIKILAVLQL